ncbi:unnamed protein product [Cuscuta epithymum]|uniref:Uncharacterized protein n=1 Tax=Cuscuta epithymum TaxID=186058 RepID=A0AAV0D299_9ASTE|nr:unnamed protein product [Cuscuta epithymum]
MSTASAGVGCGHMEKAASIGILVQTCQGWIIEEEEGIVIDLGGDDKGKERTRNFEWLVKAEGSPTIPDSPPSRTATGASSARFFFKVEDLGLEELRAGGRAVVISFGKKKTKRC